MTEPKTGEQKSTENAKPALELSEAVRIVRAAIKAEEERLQQIAGGQEEEPIMLEGETSTGYIVHVMSDPAKVAKVMLDYDYPLYNVLEEDLPQEMWDALARMVGLDSVFSLDM